MNLMKCRKADSNSSGSVEEYERWKELRDQRQNCSLQKTTISSIFLLVNFELNRSGAVRRTKYNLVKLGFCKIINKLYRTFGGGALHYNKKFIVM